MLCLSIKFLLALLHSILHFTFLCLHAYAFNSSSKEFMAAQNLVQHAFMSHKIGLRAQHLGLHKAICVLMGWNSSVPCDAITCVPEILPAEEAVAQKEDLMLWPPLVVIHNISMSNNNPEHQKVVPIEGVEAFLRGKLHFI
jgi:hypothetical protein